MFSSIKRKHFSSLSIPVLSKVVANNTLKETGCPANRIRWSKFSGTALAILLLKDIGIISIMTVAETLSLLAKLISSSSVSSYKYLNSRDLYIQLLISLFFFSNMYLNCFIFFWAICFFIHLPTTVCPLLLFRKQLWFIQKWLSQPEVLQQLWIYSLPSSVPK